jgi:RNA polymerase sigma-70 factor (ECF subfamily)
VVRVDCELLERHLAGDRDALDTLVRKNRGWLHGVARMKLCEPLRAVGDSEDVVQAVMLDLLQYGPAFVPANDRQFRGLLARMVLNRVLEIARYGRADCRDLARARALQSGEISRIGPRERSSARPDRHAEAREEAAHVQVALSLLDPEDRLIIDLHRYDGLGFADIGARLGIQTKAANKRFARAVRRLGAELRRLRTGDLDELAGEVEGDFDG